MHTPTLAIVTNSAKTNTLTEQLLNLRLNLLLCSDVSETGPAILSLICLEESDLLQKPTSPWLAWDRTGNSHAISKAYRAGARAVFPKETPIEVIVESIQRTLGDLMQNSSATKQHRQRTYRRGELILLEADAVVQVEDGVLATTMIHQDGTEVLLGLSGKGQVVVAHPNDNCHVQIVAHTDSKVQIDSWEYAASQPDFPMKLRARLQQMEGWAAMQARPSLQQRILGLLGLLAGQFGVPSELGTVIDVRITHNQLATAVGATRTSITRILSELRVQGRVSTVSKDGEDLFCLIEIPERHSHY